MIRGSRCPLGHFEARDYGCPLCAMLMRNPLARRMSPLMADPGSDRVLRFPMRCIYEESLGEALTGTWPNITWFGPPEPGTGDDQAPGTNYLIDYLELTLRIYPGIAAGYTPVVDPNFNTMRFALVYDRFPQSSGGVIASGTQIFSKDTSNSTIVCAYGGVNPQFQDRFIVLWEFYFTTPPTHPAAPWHQVAGSTGTPASSAVTYDIPGSFVTSLIPVSLPMRVNVSTTGGTAGSFSSIVNGALLLVYTDSTPNGVTRPYIVDVFSSLYFRPSQ